MTFDTIWKLFFFHNSFMKTSFCADRFPVKKLNIEADASLLSGALYSFTNNSYFPVRFFARALYWQRNDGTNQETFGLGETRSLYLLEKKCILFSLNSFQMLLIMPCCCSCYTVALFRHSSESLYGGDTHKGLYVKMRNRLTNKDSHNPLAQA